MSTILAPPQRMTVEDFLALPVDGVDRELIQGELREKGMTVRNRFHSVSVIRVGTALENWVQSQPESEYLVLGGEAGFILDRDLPTTVGIDVALMSAEVMARQTMDTTLVEGVPLLAVEILSPSDTFGDVHEKTRLYLNAGVAVVWIIDPSDHTVLVHRRSQSPVLFNANQDLPGDPELPGFKVAVSQLFA